MKKVSVWQVQETGDLIKWLILMWLLPVLACADYANMDFLKIDRTNEFNAGANRIYAIIPGLAVVEHNIDTSDMIKITDRSVYPDNFQNDYFEYLYVDGQFVHDPLPKPEYEFKPDPPTWYHKAGDPAKNTGTIGDYYLNITTGAIFHKTTNDDLVAIWTQIYTPPQRFVIPFGPSKTGTHKDSVYVPYLKPLVGGTKIIQVTPVTEPGTDHKDVFSVTVKNVTDQGFWVEVCRTDQIEPWGQNLHLHVTVDHKTGS